LTTNRCVAIAATIERAHQPSPDPLSLCVEPIVEMRAALPRGPACRCLYRWRGRLREPERELSRPPPTGMHLQLPLTDADDPDSFMAQACADDHTAIERRPGVHADTTVQTLVASLPLFFREAIVLHECINLSYSEITAVTGASALAVNKRLSRARTMLLDRGALSRNAGSNRNCIDLGGR
jgi:hypothetical protein